MNVASTSNPRPDDNDPGQRVDSPPDDAHPDVVNGHVWRTDGLTISVSRSRCHAGGWCQPHEGQWFGIALPRHGALRRRADRDEQFVDSSTGFFRRVGEVTEVSHFADELQEPVLPAGGGRRGQWRDHRQVIEATLWKLRTGLA